MCANQRCVDWLTGTLNGFQLREDTKLKAVDAKHLSKQVKVALRTLDKVSTDSTELLQWIKSLNPGLHTENWKVLDSKDEAIGRRLILLVDRDSVNATKKAGCKIYTGLSEGTFKVLSDPLLD